jgi:hypothetical protein
MVQLLGDRVLPDSVVQQRRKLRSSVNNLRDPIRQRREDLVPGPDIIGTVESNALDLRDRFVSRDMATQRIGGVLPGDRVSDILSSNGSGGNSGNSGKSGDRGRDSERTSLA